MAGITHENKHSLIWIVLEKLHKLGIHFIQVFEFGVHENLNSVRFETIASDLSLKCKAVLRDSKEVAVKLFVAFLCDCVHLVEVLDASEDGLL